MGRNSVIHGDNQLYALFRQFFHGGSVHAIAFPFPLGDVVHHIGAAGEQVGKQNGSGRDSVRIVIAINGNFLILIHRPANPGHCFFHIGQQKRVGKPGCSLQKIRSSLRGMEPSDFQHHGKESRDPGLLRDPVCIFLIQRAHFPFLDSQKTFTALPALGKSVYFSYCTIFENPIQ